MKDYGSYAIISILLTSWQLILIIESFVIYVARFHWLLKKQVLVNKFRYLSYHAIAYYSLYVSTIPAKDRLPASDGLLSSMSFC